MSDTSLTIRCYNPQQGYQQLITTAWPWLKSMLFAGHRMIITFKAETRTLDQNAKFHAICGDIAKSGMKWAGKTRTAQQWKVLLVSGHSVATKEDSEIVPGLENEFVSIRESTALMSVKRGASLITYTLAFCDMNGIKLQEDYSEAEYLRLAA